MVKYILLIATCGVLAASVAQDAWLTAALGAAVSTGALLRVRYSGNIVARVAILDATIVIQFALLIWQLGSGNLKLADPILFPEPERVLRLFFAELPDMLRGLRSSLLLLGCGYLGALATAIPLGLLLGHCRRLREASNPFIKNLGAIPPIVYIPYAIALLPSFSSASIFVIFIGAFWPVLVNTVNGVLQIPSGIIDSARILHLSKVQLFLRVLLPGAMPSICTGATLGLVFSFLLLSAAELIGATEGIGWYVKNFSDFADYERVIVGIIFIGLVISAISFATNRIEKYLLRYQEKELYD